VIKYITTLTHQKNSDIQPIMNDFYCVEHTLQMHAYTLCPPG